MDKQSYQSFININRLSDNEDFYNNVFKKTEKVISAVEYILSFNDKDTGNKSCIQAVSDATLVLHQVALESLSWFEESAGEKLYQLQHGLVVLDSTMRVAVAARALGADTTTVLLFEVDTILRHLKNHFTQLNKRLADPNRETLFSSAKDHSSARRRPRPAIPVNDLSSDAILVYSQLSDRATRIKTVLKAKPEATIKDITDIITDVSAKTIQRDLNVMIEEGTVIRQGERRWSKYSVTK